MRLFKIDHEVPDLAEWSMHIAQPPATVAQVANPTSPGLGGHVLRCATVAGKMAMAGRMAIPAPAAGEERYLGLWMCVGSPPATDAELMSLTADFEHCGLDVLADGKLRLRTTALVDGFPQRIDGQAVAPSGGWAYVVAAARRATDAGTADGWIRLYVNGALMDAVNALDNHWTMAQGSEVAFFAGGIPAASAGLDVSLDDVTLTVDEYPPPYAPPPAGEYPEARRTIVLYRPASADSCAFAQECVTSLGIPAGNLCPLPNASSEETLADYAAFQAQVEDDLLAWLGLNSSLGGYATTFLIGHGVPGAFWHGGLLHSATSRLMRLGQAFSPQAPNPLYAPAQLTRLDATALHTAGVYLAARVDGANLAESLTMLHAGAATVAINNTDVLYCDDESWRDSLACQRLRMNRSAVAPLANDALVFAAAGGYEFGPAGSLRRSLRPRKRHAGSGDTYRYRCGRGQAFRIRTDDHARRLTTATGRAWARRRAGRYAQLGYACYRHGPARGTGDPVRTP